MAIGVVGAVRRHLEDYLSEFVYGGIDGAVTTFAVVAGATGAGFSSQVLMVLGFANLIADGFSMGVGSYLSTKSEQELMTKKGKSIKNEPSPIINGSTTYVAFILVGLVPLLSYTVDYIFNLDSNSLFAITCVLTSLAFIGVGWLKSKVSKSHIVRSILETLVLGAIAASFAYFVGAFLEGIITK